MAQEILIDAYGCDATVLDDAKKVQEVATQIVDKMESKVVEQRVHHFAPQGVTYVAILSTSHLAIHTWPESGYAAVDVFSCSRAYPPQIKESICRALGASRCCMRCIERDTGGSDEL